MYTFRGDSTRLRVEATSTLHPTYAIPQKGRPYGLCLNYQLTDLQICKRLAYPHTVGEGILEIR